MGVGAFNFIHDKISEDGHSTRVDATVSVFINVSVIKVKKGVKILCNKFLYIYIKTEPESQKSSEKLRSPNVRAARERVSSPAATRRGTSFFFLLSSPRGKWCCALIGCRPLTWSSILQADAHWAGLSAQSGAPPVIPDTATCHTHTHSHTTRMHSWVRAASVRLSGCCNLQTSPEGNRAWIQNHLTMRAHCTMRHRRSSLLLRSFRR